MSLRPLPGYPIPQETGFFAYPPEEVYSRPCSVMVDGAKDVPPGLLACSVHRTSGPCPAGWLAHSQPAAWRDADVSLGLRGFENEAMRHGLGHVEPRVSEGAPCEAGQAK